MPSKTYRIVVISFLRLLTSASIVSSQGDVAGRAAVGHHHQAVDEERDRGEAAGHGAAEDNDGASQDPLQGAFIPGYPGRRSRR